MIARRLVGHLPPVFLLAAPAGVATAGSLQVIPQAINCVVADRFPRIEALLTPPEQVSLARVLFRTKGSEGWYWVRMDREADRFVAVLPKPGNGLKDLRYYIEATDTEFETSRTPEYVLEVVTDPETCRGKVVANTVASAKVIIHVPTGYKVPLVPSGFSGRGTLRAGEEKLGVFPNMSLTTALLAAGAVGAGAVAVGLSVANPPSPPGVPGTLAPGRPQGTVTLLASSPPPGSTISLSSGSLALSLRIAADQDVPPGTVKAELLHFSPKQLSCAFLSSPYAGFRGGMPQDVTVSGHLFNEGVCGASFSTEWLEVSVESSQRIEAGGVFSLNYNLVP